MQEKIHAHSAFMGENEAQSNKQPKTGKKKDQPFPTCKGVPGSHDIL
ncbi:MULTISPECIES: hypothetical protein [Akkermansia]|jgi:hypothetical protein|nr:MULTISPECIES: hypothetical protein [Akkermansia]MBT9561562.1 hypothetical protein [Candidatus Akkermansia timonensis]